MTKYQRAKNKYKKQWQRERQRTFLVKHFDVCTAEALVTRLMRGQLKVKRV